MEQLRKQRGWTPEGLGEGVGVSAAQILRYEAGESRLSTNRLFRLSRQLGVSPMAFYEEIVELDADGRLSELPGGPLDPADPDAKGDAEALERADQRLLRGLIEGDDAP